MLHDGLGKYLSQIITKAPGPTDDIVGILRDTETHVVINYLPVGSEEATKWYVEQVLTAGCGLINCIPVFIAREPYWQDRFKERGLPIIGDDIKSQVGATIVHRVLTRLFRDRGVRIDRMYQLNFGGNTDFLNMLERERLESKKISKTNAVTSQLDYEMPADDIHVGPSDYIPWLLDRKWCHIRMEGTTFGNVPLNLELKLEVWDSPNSAGVVIDAIRCCKLALDRGISGALIGPVVLLHEVAAQAVHRRQARGQWWRSSSPKARHDRRRDRLLGIPPHHPPGASLSPGSRLLLRPHHRRHLLSLLLRQASRLKAAMARVLDTDDENAISLAARRSFRNFGKYVVDFIHFLDSTPEEVRRRIVFEHLERIDQVMAEKKGVIVHHPALRELGHGGGRPVSLRLSGERGR